MPSPSSAPKYVVEYQLTEREVVGQWFRLRMLRPKTFVIYGALLAMGMALIISNYRQLIGWVLVAAPFVFAFIFRMGLQRIVRQNPNITGPRSFSFDSKGVVFASGQARDEYAWSQIQRFSETGADYFLYLKGPSSVANIPKAAFTPEQREAFLAYTGDVGIDRVPASS